MYVLTLPWMCSGHVKSKVLCSFKLPLLLMEIWELGLSCRTEGLDFQSGYFVWQKGSISTEPRSSNTTPEFLCLCREQGQALFWQMLLCEAVRAELQHPQWGILALASRCQCPVGEGKMLMWQLRRSLSCALHAGQDPHLLVQPWSPCLLLQPRWPASEQQG